MQEKIVYGIYWPASMHDWEIELKMYMFPKWGRKDLRKEPWEHFIRAAMILYGPNNPAAQFTWHPWAVDMVKAACRYQELGLCGPSSCGKSQFMAIWLILNLLAAPANTLAYATSTTIPRAKQKIWAKVVEYFNGIPEEFRQHLVLVDSPTPVIWVEINGKRLPNAGIHLVAAGSQSGREAANKLQGSKPPTAPGKIKCPHTGDMVERSADDPGHGRCILAADELSDLVHAILGAYDNLKSAAWFSAVAAANPRNQIDPFSVQVEPVDGFDSIDVDTGSWRTKRGGICLHFDDKYNPNWTAYKKYKAELAVGGQRNADGSIRPYRDPWPTKPGKDIDDQFENGDVDSPLFWRNYRGFWAPDGTEFTIYSHADVKHSGVDRNFKEWLLSKQKIRCMGVDPSFSSGGDSTIAVIGDMGWDAKRRCQVVDIVAVEEIIISATDKTRDSEVQVADGIKALLHKYNIPISNLGYDSTNGPATNTLARELQSNEFHRANFAGEATETPISDLDPMPAKEKYGNRMTELWFFGKELIRHRQLYGITIEIALELVVRHYVTGKAGKVSRITAEPKREMKKRTAGRSPDRADAMCILLDVFRQRHGLRTTITELKNSPKADGSSWLEFCKKSNSARSKMKLSFKSSPI